MFAALYLPTLPGRATERQARLLSVARSFSPRVERVRGDLLTLEVTGFERWFEDPRALGEAIRRAAADRDLAAPVAIAGTRTAALLLARGRAGLTVVRPGEEATRVGELSVAVLEAWTPPGMEDTDPRARRRSSRKGRGEEPSGIVGLLRRWGLTRLGELAGLPTVELSERLGQAGVLWQRVARGEDLQPLTPVLEDESFEESMALDWPVEQLEPLSFVLGRLFDALSARLERADRGVAILHLRLDLVGKRRFLRSIPLPAPLRDSRTLRTLALLDLESHPPPAAIDRVTVAADVVEGRIVQCSWLERALPAERLSTLLARLTALVGADRVGAPALVDSHRPGAFGMAPFGGAARRPVVGGGRLPSGPPGIEKVNRDTGPLGIRRFRRPVPVRVDTYQERPVHVNSTRRQVRSGDVLQCAGPWRTSGDWWTATHVPAGPGALAHVDRPVFGGAGDRPVFGGAGDRPVFGGAGDRPVFGGAGPWDRDEWDVTLRDGARYVLFRDRPRARWFIDGIVD